MHHVKPEFTSRFGRRLALARPLTAIACALLLIAAILAGSTVAQQPIPPSVLPSWLADFADPPATYRPQMFWVWNGEVNHERTTEVLEQYAARGVGGVFVHPRPGLITEYLSTEFFHQWDWTLKECKRLGLECHVYDENGFPSGFAGGEVIAADPTLAARYLTLVTITDARSPLAGETIACFVRSAAGNLRQVGQEALATATTQSPVHALVVKQVEPKPQHGGFPYPDILRPETAQIFLHATHERYAQLFHRDFGKTVKYVFTDEPNLIGASGIPWSDHLLEEFQRDHGYDLRNRLEALCFSPSDATSVRFDYFQTVSRLWTENFFQPIYRWCDRHNLEFTGHLWEHEWPIPEKQPLVMHTYRWMQVPGTDLLGFQFFPTAFADQMQAYLNQKELSSVANQLGRQRILCESCGGGGYAMTLRDFKPLEDYLLAAGVNVMTPHLSYQTLAGARKYDWPQTLSDHSSWWDAYRLHADHVGRVAYTLAHGREKNRVLVLHPDTTAWMYYQHKDFLLTEERKTDPLLAVRQSQQGLLAALHAHQIDFDLGDELTMAELGTVEGNRLRIGQSLYDAVIVPPAMENWTSATRQLMQDYLAAGGTVYSCAGAPTHVDGRPSSRPADLARQYTNQWKQFPDRQQMVGGVRSEIPPRITQPDGSPLPAGLCWRRHEREDGTAIYFFCHPWNEPRRVAVQLEGQSVIALDTVSGQAAPLSTRRIDAGQIVALDLPACGHALLLASPRHEPEDARQETHRARAVPLTSLGVRRMQPNVLTLLFCDLQTGGTMTKGVNTTLADELNWKAHGLSGNIWSHSAQFRRTLIEQQFAEDSGFRVSFRFTIDANALETVRQSLRLAIERPWLYKITLNDNAIDVQDADRWLDPHIRQVSIANFVVSGENRLELAARPMRPLCEIMPVYVLGDFALQCDDSAFIIVEPRPLKMRPWNEQGLPFYPHTVTYRYSFSLDEPTKQFALSLPEWSGSVAHVRIDGDEVGVIAWLPYRLEFQHSLEPGDHLCEVVVAGNMKNLLGPHFSDGLPGIWSWRWSGQETQPPEAYQFAPSGLMQTPVLAIIR